MLGSIYIGLSGMKAYSEGLETISNNVANMNTLGYKSTTVNFTDLYSQGDGGLSYSTGSEGGAGTRTLPATVDFAQGDLSTTDNDLDLAIKGSGFLVLLDGGKTYYTRTGQFAVDDKGYISQQGTEYHLAMLDEAGRAVAVNVDSKKTNPPQLTTKIVFSDNLSSSGTDATISDVKVYDSRGGEHTWSFVFNKVTSDTGVTTDWTVTVKDENGNTISTSTLKFDGSSVDASTETLTVQTTPSGADPLSVVLDFSTGVSSYSAGTTSTLRVSSSDGHAAGTLSTVTVDEDGKIKLTYSNEEEDILGAVALADIRDPQKLEAIGEGRYIGSAKVNMRLVASGTDGAGTIVSKQLEASNVDLSQEFGRLILIQRGYQASSQVVSVSNDMIQQLFGIRGQG